MQKGQSNSNQMYQRLWFWTSGWVRKAERNVVVHETLPVKLEQMVSITWQWVKTWREGSVQMILAIINQIHPNIAVYDTI